VTVSIFFFSAVSFDYSVARFVGKRRMKFYERTDGWAGFNSADGEDVLVYIRRIDCMEWRLGSPFGKWETEEQA
jgi:hypothetical protein